MEWSAINYRVCVYIYKEYYDAVNNSDRLVTALSADQQFIFEFHKLCLCEVLQVSVVRQLL